MVVNRAIIKAIQFYKDKYPVLTVTGPRQSGKTTLLKELFPDYQYLSLENPDLRAFAEDDPNGFFEKYSRYCIFDEVQRVPKLFSYLQTIVDRDKIMGQFILSGSQNFHLMKNITQSLAGRVALFKLLPFDFNELKSENLLHQDYAETMIKGFYPAIFDRNIPSKTFYSNYIQTYVERDITEIINIRDIRTFRIFLSLCASRAGQLLSLNSLANECGITQPTAKAWLSVLESSYVLFLLQPYHKNFDKRVIKSPKLYFYDTGLLCHLLKIKDANQIKSHSYKGNLFENMIVCEYVKQNYHQNLMQDFWFWRDSAGHEVDLIRQDDNLLNIIEIKSTATISQNLFNGLDYFQNLAKEDVKSKSLVYAGLDSQKRTNVNVVSWYELNN
jgi:predicted AAA+ superfamily ATPase